ncbi:MAG: 4Fe-4S binding protein [Oscillospiraceae bacterium]|jgi:NAD-dependent dihydropyrimidine dehydrogenase PreA subunit|nr:4Fe-4S binding protein [Oscillospiraceae bacterium]
MAYTIGDECVSCGACAPNCPVDAISQGSSHYEIDTATCVECGSCAESCPMSAISS